MSSKRADSFTALADPTRRSILALLGERQVLSAGEIATRYPHMSRAAVSKHLGILRKTHLVRARDHGRQVHYRLDPSPLAEVADWLAIFSDYWDQSLDRLKRQAEATQ